MSMMRKTEQVKKQLISYIRDHDLRCGDRLPSQDELRRQFDVGTSTIGIAIKELHRDGVLEVRNKVGIFVRNHKADGHFGQIIGISAKYVLDTPYYSSLICSLEQVLLQHNCHARVFHCDSRATGRGGFDLADFPGLQRSIMQKELDGLIHLDDFNAKSLGILSRSGLPFMFVGNIGNSPHGLFFDQAQMLNECCRLFSEYPRERIVLVVQKALRGYLEGIWKELTCGKSQIFTVDGLCNGMPIARALIDMPEERQPQLVVYMDDIIAQQITAILAMELPRARLPHAALIRNKQLLLNYAVPRMFEWQIDHKEVAELSVNHLLKALREGNNGIGRHQYRMRFIQEE